MKNRAGQVTLVQTGYGVGNVQADEVATSYTDDGEVATLTDAENNKTRYVYDGLDRVAQVFLPNPAKGAGVSSTVDYEQFSYDENGNVKTRWLRDATLIGYLHDSWRDYPYRDVELEA